MGRRAICPLLLSLLTAACGASTGLREGDAGVDAGVDVGVDAPETQVLRPFERCTPRDTCGGGTSCRPALFTANATAARFCTLDCASALSCPPMATHSALSVLCLTILDAGTPGQCYEGCQRDVQCGPGMRCVTDDSLTFPTCLPVGVAP